jgi:membrane-bound ClpP family serine protease
VSIEAGYWIALILGVSFLLLSVVMGDVFDFLDFLDFDLGDGFAATPVLFTALAAFGGGGLLAINGFGASPGLSVLWGLGAGIVGGALTTGFFALLRRQEAGEGFTVGQLVGARGRCTLAIHPGKEGRVAVQYEGLTRSFSATSSEEIASGDDVTVIDVFGTSLKVSRTEETAAPHGH